MWIDCWEMERPWSRVRYPQDELESIHREFTTQFRIQTGLGASFHRIHRYYSDDLFS